MSRLGKRPITIPSSTEVSTAGATVKVKGKLGELRFDFNPNIAITIEDGSIELTRKSDSKQNKSLHGLTHSIVRNMIQGVSEGFKKELDIVGVGWNAKMKGKELVLQIGFCHTVDFDIPKGITVDLPKPQKIIISGIDKQAVGHFAACIRKIRPPEPYKGKGIRYVDEHVVRKVGKSQVGK